MGTLRPQGLQQSCVVVCTFCVFASQLTVYEGRKTSAKNRTRPPTGSYARSYIPSGKRNKADVLRVLSRRSPSSSQRPANSARGYKPPSQPCAATSHMHDTQTQPTGTSPPSSQVVMYAQSHVKRSDELKKFGDLPVSVLYIPPFVKPSILERI